MEKIKVSKVAAKQFIASVYDLTLAQNLAQNLSAKDLSVVTAFQFTYDGVLGSNCLHAYSDMLYRLALQVVQILIYNQEATDIE